MTAAALRRLLALRPREWTRIPGTDVDVRFYPHAFRPRWELVRGFTSEGCTCSNTGEATSVSLAGAVYCAQELLVAPIGVRLTR